jgi:Ni/Co efflux regulator RcnB
MALKAIVATLVLGTSSLALAGTPREARVEHRIHAERAELRTDRRIEHRIERRDDRREYRREGRVEHRQFERGRRIAHRGRR